MPPRPATPELAITCCGPLDDLLDAALFKALAEPTRLRLFGCLIKCGRPCSVSELAACCAVDLSVVSRHLQQLERAGVVTVSKRGRVVSYTARYAQVALQLHTLADAITACDPNDCCDARTPSPKHAKENQRA